MSQIALYLLACLMVVATVNCKDFEMHLPKSVPSLENYCKSKQYAGECQDLNRHNRVPNCAKTFCAATGHGIKRKGIHIGHMPDGLKCGTNHVCYSGTCTQLTKNAKMPIQARSESHANLKCY